MTTTPKPLVLMILDGFGHSDSPESNAVFAAKKPVLDRLWATVPNGLISGSGMDVGLPDGQMGNSEVGHMNLGAGRVVYQDFTRVTKAIRDGEFFENPTICAAVDKAVAAGKAVHFMGLLSDGGVHSHQDHLIAMAELAFKRGAEKSTCTPSSMAATRRRKAPLRRSNCSTRLSRPWAKAGSPASSAAISPWTVTTVGIESPRPTT